MCWFYRKGTARLAGVRRLFPPFCQVTVKNCVVVQNAVNEAGSERPVSRQEFSSVGHQKTLQNPQNRTARQPVFYPFSHLSELGNTKLAESQWSLLYMAGAHAWDFVGPAYKLRHHSVERGICRTVCTGALRVQHTVSMSPCCCVNIASLTESAVLTWS